MSGGPEPIRSGDRPILGLWRGRGARSANGSIAAETSDPAGDGPGVRRRLSPLPWAINEEAEWPSDRCGKAVNLGRDRIRLLRWAECWRARHGGRGDRSRGLENSRTPTISSIQCPEGIDLKAVCAGIITV